MPEKEYKEYAVSWTIELTARSHEAAAEDALRIQKYPFEHEASVFEVAELSENDGELVKIEVTKNGTRRL